MNGIVHGLRTITENRINYWLSYVVDLTLALVFGHLGWRAGGDALAALASFAVGALLFSFVEYGIHRWLFHSPLSFMTPIHQNHHEHPRAAAALPFFCSIVVTTLSWTLLSNVMKASNAGAFLSGFMLAYFCYSLVHHLQHSIRIKQLPFRWLQRRWVAHAVHHGRRDANFGVTSPLWDHVFRTHRR